MPRLSRPLDTQAVKAADDEFYAKHPELVKDGKRIPLSATDPSQAALRKEWVDLYKKNGGKEEGEDEKMPAKKPDDPVQPCPAEQEDEPKIISVAYLDGADDKEIAGGKQIVNLPRDAKWVDGVEAQNIDRLSHKPRIKVRFNKPGSHSFKVKYLPDGGNAVYSGAEKGRTSHFKYQDQQKSYSTDGDGTKILPIDDFFVAAAGKDKYKLEAEDDKGNKVQSGDLEIHRLIYYVEIKMKTLSAVATSLGTLEGEFAKHNIKLVALPSVEMDHMPNIGAGDDNTFKTKARTAYDTSQAPGKQPYVVAIAYTDHLAVKNPNQRVIKASVQVGPGKPAVDIPIAGPGLTNPAVKDRYLWNNLVPGEGWFVSAKFLRDGGTPGTDDVAIPEAQCTAVPASAAKPDMCKKVSVDVTGLPAGTGTITLEVHWVDRMRGGLSFPGGNLICICTRAWWADKTTEQQNQVMVHELGHTVGMVADGTGKLPDAVATLYTSAKGHVGNHCYNGNADGQARYDSATDSANSTCVMYGATNGKSAFCGNCAPAVRKLDICDGWSKF